MKRYKLAPGQPDKIIAAYHSGDTVMQLAVSNRLSIGFVYRILKRYGVKLQTRERTVPNHDVLQSAGLLHWAAWMSKADIAAIAGVNEHEVAKAMRKSGYPSHSPFNVVISRIHLEDLYAHKGLSAKEIAQRIGTSSQTVFMMLKQYDIPRRPRLVSIHGPKRKRNQKGFFEFNGYRYIRINRGDPLFCMGVKSKSHNHSKFVGEHRIVMARHIGRPLERWEIVHHKNHQRGDNRLENLELVNRAVEHHSETIMHGELLKARERIQYLETLLREQSIKF